jgi:hypothetical protein
MATIDLINVGAAPDDGNGDPLRDAFIKSNDNDTAINDQAGQNTNDITDLDTDKADKIVPAQVNNLAGLDASGNLTDSGLDPTDILSEPIDKIDFAPQDPALSYVLGRIFYDEVENTWTAYNDMSDISLQLGEELRARLENDTGGTLFDGKAVAIIGSVGINLQVELLDTSNIDSSFRGFGLMTQTVLDGNQGYTVRYGAVRNQNTILFTAGEILYGDPDNPGELVNVRPVAPNYPVRIGICVVSDTTLGVIGVDTLAFNGSDTGVNLEGTLNGMVTQTPNINFIVDGGVIYADVTNEYYPTKKLPIVLGGVRYLLDTLTGSGSGGAARIVVPPGNAPSAGDGGQKSWLYVTLNAGVPELGASTSKPTIQNAGICTVVAFDAATTLAAGRPQAYRRENNASDSKTEGVTGSYGFTRVLADDSRSRGSAWDSGQDPTPTVNDTTIRLALSAGIGKQLHYTGLPAFDGLLYQVYNDATNAITYQNETNLINIVTDAQGGTLLGNGFYYTFRFYYKLNSNGIGNDIVVTRPQGHYGSGAGAESDALKYTTTLADTGIEDIVYPLFDLVIGRTGGGGTTVTQYSITSLRSKTPGVGGGSGGAGVTTDDKIRISSADTTNDYLNPKIAVTDNIIKTILNPAGNEQLQLDIAASIDKKVAFELGILIDPDSTYLPANGVTFDDGTSAIYLSTANAMIIRLGGVDRWRVFTSEFYANITLGAKMKNATPSGTVAGFTFHTREDVGIGTPAANQLSLIANSVEAVHIEEKKTTFNGQVVGGSHTKSFSATPEFDFADGNTQQITLTANITSWTIANELPAGAYTIYFTQDGTGGWAIPDPTGIDAETDNSIADFLTTPDSENIVNVFVKPDGTTYWSLVETIT